MEALFEKLNDNKVIKKDFILTLRYFRINVRSYPPWVKGHISTHPVPRTRHSEKSMLKKSVNVGHLDRPWGAQKCARVKRRMGPF